MSKCFAPGYRIDTRTERDAPTPARPCPGIEGLFDDTAQGWHLLTRHCPGCAPASAPGGLTELRKLYDKLHGLARHVESLSDASEILKGTAVGYSRAALEIAQILSRLTTPGGPQ